MDEAKEGVTFHDAYARVAALILNNREADVYKRQDDYIGGRYSSTSAVGGAVLSLAFGPAVFAQFLDGAAAERCV